MLPAWARSLWLGVTACAAIKKGVPVAHNNHLLLKAMQYVSGREWGETGIFKCCRLDAKMLWRRFSKPI